MRAPRPMLDALRRSGYVNVRRLVRRMNLSAHDAPVLMGMLRQILWKLGG